MSKSPIILLKRLPKCASFFATHSTNWFGGHFVDFFAKKYFKSLSYRDLSNAFAMDTQVYHSSITRFIHRLDRDHSTVNNQCSIIFINNSPPYLTKRCLGSANWIQHNSVHFHDLYLLGSSFWKESRYLRTNALSDLLGKHGCVCSQYNCWK